MHKISFAISSIKSSSPLEMVFSDVWGPAPIPSVDGLHYYLIFVDYFTKYVWLFPTKQNLKFPKFFQNLRSWLKFFSTDPLFLFTQIMVVSLFIFENSLFLMESLIS